MKRLAHHHAQLALLALVMLFACAPQATEEPAEGRLFYRTTVDGDLLITTVPPEQAEGVEYPPLVSGYSDITGYDLQLKSGAYCVDACQPNANGYIGLRFEPKQRGNRIVVPVLAGEPVLGETRMDIGLDVSVTAVFEPSSQ